MSDEQQEPQPDQPEIVGEDEPGAGERVEEGPAEANQNRSFGEVGENLSDDQL
jgi:hypothetical protein